MEGWAKCLSELKKFSLGLNLGHSCMARKSTLGIK